MLFPSSLMTLGLLSLASGHCLISTATGDLGGNGTGLGVVSGGVNQQSDVTIYRKLRIWGDYCRAIDAATALAAQLNLTGKIISQISAAAGVLTMTLHQINADGAGPVTCQISVDATNAKFVALTITTNVPSTNGKSTAANEDFSLVVEIPAGTTCTGAIGVLNTVCSVKCANPVDPFIGIVLVQQVVAKKIIRGLGRL